MRRSTDCRCPGVSTAHAVGLLGCMLVIAGLLAPPPAMAGVDGSTCLEQTTNVTCTANDVRLGQLEVVGEPQTCEEGSTITVDLKATIESGPARYDIGLWINESGGSARDDADGTCYRDFLDPAAAEEGGVCDSTVGPYANLDGDLCGDIPADATGCANTFEGPCTDGSGGTCLFTTYSFTATILCTDSNNDGTADAGTCTSWSQNVDDVVCTDIDTALQALPGSPAKCFCSPVEISGLFTGCREDLDCDDGISCTTDTCVVVDNNGTCFNTPDDNFCDGLDDQCNDGVCDPVNDCVAVPKADSTPCEDGSFCTSETGVPATPDHCEAGVCVGIPVDCGPGDQCNDNVCNEATDSCGFVPKADSTPCEDGSFCTSETGTPQTPDHCEAGQCVGIPVDCSAGDDQCNDGVCDPSDGACIAEPKADSTPCEDGSFCTSETGAPGTPDHCEAGECVGVPVDCSALDDQCNDGICEDATGACLPQPKADSTPCEDGSACTSETGAPQTPDHCEAGQCVGVPVDCSALDDQCNDGICEDVTGACLPEPKADSTPCEDGDACTSETGAPQTPDHCEAGQCVGVPVDCSALDDQCNDGICEDATGACLPEPKPLSTPCEDGDACTSETGTPQTPDHCDGAGSCVGVPVDCSALDDQCNDGICEDATGACLPDPKPLSTPCEDGDACTSETGTPQTPDHCDGAGSCVGVPVDCSAADDQCNVGTCDPGDGACFPNPVADSTPCEDGDACTSETGVAQTPDHCFGGVCTGVPVDCSAEDDQCNVGTCDPADGACFPDPVEDSTPCEDGEFCTSETGTPQTPDHCEAGVCTGVPVDCSALDDQCNVGACDPADGACFADPEPRQGDPCEDGFFCTSDSGSPGEPDACQDGECVGNPVDCDEGAFCTDDSCDEENDVCINDPNDELCIDGRVCTDELCDPFDPEATPSGCVYTFNGIDPDPSTELNECLVICRTAGFWGTHALLIHELLEQGYGGFEICGQTLESIWVHYEGSAVEGLCIRTQGDKSKTVTRQLIAALQNCILTTGNLNLTDGACVGTVLDEFMLESGEIVNLWQFLSDSCTAARAGDDLGLDAIKGYTDYLDCWNNGGDLSLYGDYGCTYGQCDGIPGEYCGDLECGDGQECIPFADSCHVLPLENEDLGFFFETAGQWVDSERCRDARHNSGDYWLNRCPGHPACGVFQNP